MAVLQIRNEITSQEEQIINSFYGLESVSFASVDDFLNSMDPLDNVIDLRLHCPGGSCLEGWAIYDALRNSGKRITATIEGVCASMASVILLAAPENRRRAYPNASLLIHNPWTVVAGGYTAEELEVRAEDLKREQTKILDLYVERTGGDRKALQKLMDEDKLINMDKAKELGFVSEIIKPNTASIKPNSKNMDGKFKEAFASFAKSLGFRMVSDVVALSLTSLEGVKVDIDTEGDNPKVGDKATPDGTHTIEFESGEKKVITVEGGKITAITPYESADDKKKAKMKELEELKAKFEAHEAAIAQLKIEREGFEASINALKVENGALKAGQITEAQSDILASVEKMGGAEWVKRMEEAKGSYTPPVGDPTHNGKNQEEQPVRAKLSERLEQMRNRKRD